MTNRRALPPSQMVEIATTPEEIAAMIERAASAISANVLEPDAQGLPLPPWKSYPNIERYSIGWRMGPGEDYWIVFRNWCRAQSTGEKERYSSKYPEPNGWSEFYVAMTRE